MIGQSLFGQEVYKELRKDGYIIVGVFTIPDKDGKADPLGEKSHCDAAGATAGGLRVFVLLSHSNRSRKGCRPCFQIPPLAREGPGHPRGGGPVC